MSTPRNPTRANPEHALVVQLHAVARQQDMQATVAKPATLGCQSAQPRSDGTVHKLAGPPLRVALLPDRPGHGRPPQARRHQFFASIMAELESSLISERVTADMRAAEARGKHLGRPAIPKRIVSEIEALALSTDLSIRQIQARIAGQASRGIIGEITKRARATPPTGL